MRIHHLRVVAGLALIIALPRAVPAHAQEASELGADRFTIGINGGAVFPAQDLVEDQVALDAGGAGGLTGSTGTSVCGRMASWAF